VATISRLLKIIGLFCRISALLQGSFAKETYNFKEPTNRSHPISISTSLLSKAMDRQKDKNDEFNTQPYTMHFNTLQHSETTPTLAFKFTAYTASHCTTLQHIYTTHIDSDEQWTSRRHSMLTPSRITHIHCNTQQHAATRCNTLHHTATHLHHSY